MNRRVVRQTGRGRSRLAATARGIPGGFPSARCVAPGEIDRRRATNARAADCCFRQTDSNSSGRQVRWLVALNAIAVLALLTRAIGADPLSACAQLRPRDRSQRSSVAFLYLLSIRLEFFVALRFTNCLLDIVEGDSEEILRSRGNI